MKIQELIIGAYVKSKKHDAIVQVDALGSRNTRVDGGASYSQNLVLGLKNWVSFSIDGESYAESIENMEPIEITPEWLAKFGFVEGVKNSISEWWHKKYNDVDDDIAIRLNKSGDRYYELYVNEPTCLAFIHVHDLQNLYQFITGTMLE